MLPLSKVRARLVWVHHAIREHSQMPTMRCVRVPHPYPKTPTVGCYNRGRHCWPSTSCTSFGYRISESGTCPTENATARNLTCTNRAAGVCAYTGTCCPGGGIAKPASSLSHLMAVCEPPRATPVPLVCPACETERSSDDHTHQLNWARQRTATANARGTTD